MRIESLLPASSTQAAEINSGAWDPTALTPFWADVEISGLLIAADLILLESSDINKAQNRPNSYSTQLPIITDALNSISTRLTALINESSASPKLKDHAGRLIDHYKKDITNGKSGYLNVAIFSGGLIQIINNPESINLDLNKILAVFPNFDKGVPPLPEDDGTALFCLALIATVIGSVQHYPNLKEPVQNHLELIDLIGTLDNAYLTQFYDQETVNKAFQSVVQTRSAPFQSFVQQTLQDLGIVSPPLPPPIDYDTTQPLPPYDSSAPDAMFRLYSMPGNDVLSKSYLFLDWMEKNTTNTNGAEVFFLYLSSLASAGYFGGSEGNALSEGLLSIQSKGEQTLVDEVVDITMLQMCMKEKTPADAASTIQAYFPGNDPISRAIKAEAEEEMADISSGKVKVPATQYELSSEWNAFMTDSGTVASINSAKSALMNATIHDCGNNIYAALAALLLLLDSIGMNSLDAYGTLSKQLAKDSEDLNSLITRWNDGFANADEAEAWMKDLQALEDEMDQTPFDSSTQILIDKQFETIKNQPALTPTYVGYQDTQGNAVNASGQAVDAKGYPLYEVENSKNSNGATAYKNPNDGKYYIEGSDSPVDADKGTTYKPLYWTDDPSAKGGLTDKSGNTVNNRKNPTSTVPGITPVEYSNYLYIDPNNKFLYTVSATGKAPPGATVYTAHSNDQFDGMQYYVANDGSTVFLQQPPGTERLTLGDQAYNGSSYTYIDLTFNAGGTSHSYKSNGKGTNENLYTTMQLYQPQEINPNSISTGGFSSEDEAIDSSLNALISPLSQQTSAVGAEMQQTSSNIELYDNTFTSILIQGLNGTMTTISGNMRV